jgi:hypothetical protein
VQVIGSQFSKTGEHGDFGWMIKRPEYADALFIFNDNEEQFLAYMVSRKDAKKVSERAYGCQDGGGNAAIRHYRCSRPPRAAGVPTGWIGSHDGKPAGGYPKLTPDVSRVLEEAFAELRRVLGSGRYQRVFYSATSDGDLATKIFTPGDDVKRYIVAELKKLGS